VNEYLGFDEYWFYENRYADPAGDTYGGIMTDRPFYADLLAQLDRRSPRGRPASSSASPTRTMPL
jgi:hypothetical protein